jgi:hypothetical protein
MPSVNITVAESVLGSAAAAASTGALFIPVQSDSGPSGGFTLCQQLTDYTNTFGQRSSTASVGYDVLDQFFSDGGAKAYVTRVSDSTAAKARITLADSTGTPTVIVTALTAGTDGNGLEVQTSVSGEQFTVEILDSSGDLLDSHGPYTTQAALLADTSSTEVAFTQVTGSDSSSAIPAAGGPTPLVGGVDPSDISDASFVSALANFPKTLGPGTVVIPGRTTAAIAQGLAAHAFANNRFFVVDQVDASTSASSVASAAALAIPASQAKAGIVVQGSLVLPPVAGGTANRTVPGSAAVAALRAQVSATGNDNTAPAGVNFQLSRPVGFTTAFGIGTGLPGAVVWNEGDASAFTSGGVCFFASMFGVNCLDEYVTQATSDAIFDQANAWTTVMQLVSECQQVGAEFAFAPIIDITLTALHGALASIVQTLFAAGALYGDSADDAASINTGSPVNTAATAQAKQLNAQIAVKLAPYADAINIAINVLSLTQSVGASS